VKQLIANIKEDAVSLLEKVASSEELDNLRVKFLGKKGELTSVLKGLGSVAPEERPVIGQLANEVRAFIEEKISEKKQEERGVRKRAARLSLLIRKRRVASGV